MQKNMLFEPLKKQIYLFLQINSSYAGLNMTNWCTIIIIYIYNKICVFFIRLFIL